MKKGAASTIHSGPNSASNITIITVSPSFLLWGCTELLAKRPSPLGGAVGSGRQPPHSKHVTCTIHHVCMLSAKHVPFHVGMRIALLRIPTQRPNKRERLHGGVPLPIPLPPGRTPHVCNGADCKRMHYTRHPYYVDRLLSQHCYMPNP